MVKHIKYYLSFGLLSAPGIQEKIESAIQGPKTGLQKFSLKQHRSPEYEYFRPRVQKASVAGRRAAKKWLETNFSMGSQLALAGSQFCANRLPMRLSDSRYQKYTNGPFMRSRNPLFPSQSISETWMIALAPHSPTSLQIEYCRKETWTGVGSLRRESVLR